MKKSQQGFTIIEIVVALVVLGILMGAAATQLNRFRATSYQTAANNIAMSMQQAVNIKYASISQALSASGVQASACGATPNAFCTAAYNGAISLLSNTARTAIQICGMQFQPAVPSGTAVTNGPFAINADLGGGWRVDTTPIAAGAGARLVGPDGRPYTAEVPILAAATFCN